jgi:hypothetical protein
MKRARRRRGARSRDFCRYDGVGRLALRGLPVNQAVTSGRLRRLSRIQVPRDSQQAKRCCETAQEMKHRTMHAAMMTEDHECVFRLV